MPADADAVNEVCRRLHEHESFDELLTQARQAHARLVRAARDAPDLDAPCLRRASDEGTAATEAAGPGTGSGHVRQLQEAASGR